MMEFPIGKRRIQAIALIDDADLALVSCYNWQVHSEGYAVGRRKIGNVGKRKGVRRPKVRVFMHRLILNVLPCFDIDHINGNRLDNRRENLRVATRSLNMANGPSRPNSTSKYRGVHWIKTEQKWRAAITVNYKTIVAGKFAAEQDAALAYNALARQHFGDFARLNVVE